MYLEYDDEGAKAACAAEGKSEQDTSSKLAAFKSQVLPVVQVQLAESIRIIRRSFPEFAEIRFDRR